MSIEGWIVLTFLTVFTLVLAGEFAIGWIMSRIVGRAAQSFVVPDRDAEALLGRSHKGWRLWTLRLSAMVIIVTLLWAVIPRPRTAAKWIGNEVVDRAIDKTVNAAERRGPGAAAHSEKIRQGMRKGAVRAYDKVKPK